MWGRVPIWLAFFKLGWNHQLDIQSSSHNSRYMLFSRYRTFSWFLEIPQTAIHPFGCISSFFWWDKLPCPQLVSWPDFWTSTTIGPIQLDSGLESRQRTTVPLATLVTTSPAQAARSIGAQVFWGEIRGGKVGRWFLMIFSGKAVVLLFGCFSFWRRIACRVFFGFLPGILRS